MSAAEVIAAVWRAYPTTYRQQPDHAPGYMIAAEHVAELLDHNDRRSVRASVQQRINELDAMPHPSAAIGGALAAYRRAFSLL